MIERPSANGVARRRHQTALLVVAQGTFGDSGSPGDIADAPLSGLGGGPRAFMHVTLGPHAMSGVNVDVRQAAGPLPHAVRRDRAAVLVQVELLANLRERALGAIDPLAHPAAGADGR